MLKKIAVTLLAATGLVAYTQGQGTVNFNTLTVGTVAQVYDAPTKVGGLVGAQYLNAGTNWLAQLYAANGYGRLEEELVPIGNPVNFRSAVNAGYVQVTGTTTLGVAVRAIVTNSAVSPAGGPMTVQLRAWWSNTNSITTYEAAAFSTHPNARSGRSPVMSLPVTGNPSPGPDGTLAPDLAGSITNNQNVVTSWELQGFTLNTNPPAAALGGSATVSPSPLTASAGGTATFTVNVTGFPLTYQWRSHGTNLPGRTLEHLSLFNVENNDEGPYDCVVSNVPNTLRVISSSANLVVQDPAIVTQPASRTNAAGSSAIFTVGAAGEPPLAYHWKRGATPLVDGGNIAGSLTPSLTLSGVQQVDATNGAYSVDVTGLDGVVSSLPATLTVADPINFVTGPASRTNNAGTTATFTVSSDGNLLSYQWYKGVNALANGGNVAGADTATLTVSGCLRADAGSYNVHISNISDAHDSTNALLTVIDPVITVQPVDQYAATNTDATFSVTAVGTSVGYQWYLVGTGPLPFETNSTHLVHVTAANDFQQYSVVVFNQYGALTSSVASLIVAPAGDIKPPKVVLTGPKSGSEFETNQIVLFGSAGDDRRIVSASIRLNGGAWNPLPLTILKTTPKVGTFTNLVTIGTGTNVVELKCSDGAQLVSPVLTAKYFVRVAEPLTLVTNGFGSVTVATLPPVAPNKYYVGRSYTLATLPNLGNLYSNLVQTLPDAALLHSASPGEALTGMKVITFMMRSNLTLQTTFNTNNFLVYAGEYHGLFSDPAGVAHQSAGYIKIKVDSKLKFTGKLYMQGEGVSIGGTFGLGGVGTLKKLAYRKGYEETALNQPIYVVPQLDLTGAKMISGTISNAGWNATFEADLKVWSPSNSPTTITGLYTMILPGAPNASVAPGGHGYITVPMLYDPIKGTADIKAKGLLGDTQKFKVIKLPASKDGRWPFYGYAYDGVRGAYKTSYGSLWGWLQFTNWPNPGGPSNNIQGDLTWTKTAGWGAIPPVIDLYPAGFSNELTIAASPYVVPAQIAPLPGEHAIDVTNATVFLEDGNLTSSITNTSGVWNDLNKIVFPKVTSGFNPQDLKLTVSTKDGVMKGTFISPANPTIKTKITGAVLQSGVYSNTAWGNFPGLNTQSGSYYLRPQVPADLQ